MKKNLNVRFEEMSRNEMENIGGGDILVGVLVGIVLDAALKSFTGKGAADWVSDGVDAAVDKVVSLF